MPYLFPITISVILLSNLNFSESFFYKTLNNLFVKKVGILSYSLYLRQQLFINEQPWSGYFNFSDTLLFNLILLSLVANISYNFLELPFLKFKERFY